MNIMVSISLGADEYSTGLDGNATEIAEKILVAVGGDATTDTVHVSIQDAGYAGVSTVTPPIEPPPIEPPPDPTVVVVNSTFATNNAPPPGDKQTRTNAAAPADVTAIYIDDQSNDDVDISSQLLALVPGDQIEVRGVNDTTRFAKFVLTAAPIDQTDFVELPVSFEESAGNLVNGACTLTYPEKL